MELCTVDTSSGRVQGLVSGGIRQFKGVPYGASTAGANRFQRPQRPDPWTGARECFGYAPVSPQVPCSGSQDAHRMCQALASTWLTFAKSGNPNNAQIPAWPRFDAEQRATLIFDRATRVEHDPHAALRKLWSSSPLPASVLG